MNNPFLWEGAHPLPPGSTSQTEGHQRLLYCGDRDSDPALDRVKLTPGWGRRHPLGVPPSQSVRMVPFRRWQAGSQRGGPCDPSGRHLLGRRPPRPSRSPRPSPSGVASPPPPLTPALPGAGWLFVIGPGPSPLAGLPGAPSPLPQPGRAGGPAATLTRARVPGSGPGAPPPAQQRPRGVQAHGAALLLHPEHRAQRLRRPHRARRPGRRLLGRAGGARGAEGRGTVSGPLEPAGARRRRRRGAGGARAGGRRCVTPYAERPRAPRRGRGQRAEAGEGGRPGWGPDAEG